MLSVAFGYQSGHVSHKFSILISFMVEGVSRGYNICIQWWYHKVKGPQCFNLWKLCFNCVTPVTCLLLRVSCNKGSSPMDAKTCSITSAPSGSITSALLRPIALSRRSAIVRFESVCCLWHPCPYAASSYWGKPSNGSLHVFLWCGSASALVGGCWGLRWMATTALWELYQNKRKIRSKWERCRDWRRFD